MPSHLSAARTGRKRREAPARRTQAERRAATRKALLAATIDVLIDAGYAGVTTRAVSERAGVSIGALQHHFGTKSDLVAAAIEHLTAELTRELVARAPTARRSERELAEQLLDVLWEFHSGPLMAAVAELAVAARTDPELRDRLAPVQRRAIAASHAVTAHLFPAAAAGTPVAALMDTALGTLRGLALLRFVDPAAAEAMWPSTRRHLLTLAFGRLDGRRS
jgi:AcrR family transcriptional regulator